MVKARTHWWSAALVAAACAALTTAVAVTVSGREAVVVGVASVAVACCAGWALRSQAALADTRAAVTAHRTAAERLDTLATAREAEVRHLETVRLPAIAERVRTGRPLDDVPGPSAPAASLGAEFAESLQTVVRALASDEAARRERALRDSVQAAFESVARNMHAMSMVQQQVLDGVERLVTDGRLLAEVMKADHAAAQMTRKAQTLLVMCGVWPARRETRPVTLFDCVRGAQSRIVEFARVEVHGGQTLYAVAPAAEGLMHAIAELLENATVFSPSRTHVAVSVREVAAGAVVEIDDAGLGMPPDVLEQALGQLREDLDLAQLGAVPRLGLACVGRWSRELGFGVELSTASAYGGTRAVMFVPHRLLTEPAPPTSAEEAADRAAAGVPAGGVPSIGDRARTRVEGPGPTGPPATGDDPPATADPPVGDVPTPAAGGEHTATGAPGEPDGSAPDAGAPSAAGRPLGGLPQRRNRRRTPEGSGRSGGSGGLVPPRRTPASEAPPWTPDAAGASVASVVAGIRRGRAELDEPPGRHRSGGDERDRVRDQEGDR